jgi:hypothetical protein
MADGLPIRRPCVLASPAGLGIAHVAVVDSGSPITVADPAFLTAAGIDPVADEPAMTVPLTMGGSFSLLPMYDIDVELMPPNDAEEPFRWRAFVGLRSPWRHPFALLLGQRGWFDTFPTTISVGHTTVQLPPS